MKKILTIVGTRPELIRLSEIIKLLDVHTHHIFVHTGQNFTPELHNQFFHDLDLRLPDYQFNQEGKSGLPYIGNMLQDVDHILDIEKPDVVLILGDTHSALSAYTAKRRKIPIFHMEAGNRCYDDNVPEETNRKIIDSLSTYLLPYTQRSRENLLAEGYHPSKIIVIGNPIVEILKTHNDALKKRIIDEDYILVTLHRDENVTNKTTLQNIVMALEELSKSYRILFSMHPKLEEMISKFDIKITKKIELSKPFGFKQFLNLEKYAKCVLSDSGTVPEECCILGTPCVLLRTSTERPELLENNSMILSGVTTDEILTSTEVAMNTSVGRIPDEYRDTDTSQKILKLLLRHI